LLFHASGSVFFLALVLCFCCFDCRFHPQCLSLLLLLLLLMLLMLLMLPLLLPPFQGDTRTDSPRSSSHYHPHFRPPPQYTANLPIEDSRQPPPVATERAQKPF